MRFILLIPCILALIIALMACESSPTVTKTVTERTIIQPSVEITIPTIPASEPTATIMVTSPTPPPITITVKTTPTPPSPTQPIYFEPIIINGNGDMVSHPFAVTTDEWRIEWSYIPDPENPEWSVFGFFIYPRGETSIFVESGMFISSEITSGSSYSYAGQGEYYLKVTAANIQSWTITIKPAG